MSIDEQLASIAAQMNNITITGQSEDNSFVVPREIIGGRNADRNEYLEYTLVILTDENGNISGLCGGTLISSFTILTAAHCSQNPALSYFTLPGFYTFTDPFTPDNFVQVGRVVVHPDYVAATFDNDVAVMTLSRGSSLPVAAVYEGNENLDGTEGVVIGTGLTQTTPVEATQNILQEVEAPIISNSACNSAFNQALRTIITPPIVTNNMLCAGFATDGRGTCSGDSGGPLLVDFDGVRTIVGTVSFGFVPCETNRTTNAYARTSALSDFIRSASPNTAFVQSSSAISSLVPVLLLLSDDE